MRTRAVCTLAACVWAAIVCAGCGVGASSDTAPVTRPAAAPSLEQAIATTPLPTDKIRACDVMSGQDNWFDLDGSVHTFAMRTPAGGQDLNDVDVFAVGPDGRQVEVGGFGGSPAGYAMSLKWTPRNGQGRFQISVVPGAPPGRRLVAEFLASSWEHTATAGPPGAFRWPDERQ